MIEVIVRYDLTPELDEQNYQLWTRKAVQRLMQAPGVVQISANRSLISATVRIVLTWENAACWGAFADKPEWQKLISELTGFTREVNVELWGSSPLVPEPLRIKKKEEKKAEADAPEPEAQEPETKEDAQE